MSAASEGQQDIRLVRSGGYREMAVQNFQGHTDQGRKTAFYRGFASARKFLEEQHATELQKARVEGAERERNEWASHFEHVGSTVPLPGHGAKTTFTGAEVAAMLRGPKPFGAAQGGAS